MEAFVVFLPLIGALISGFFGRSLGDRGSQIITSSLLAVAAILSWVLFFQVAVGGNPRTVTLFNWVTSGDFTFDWALRVDSLTAVMLIVVNTLSFVVHVYAIGYMHHDKSIPRFMAYLSFFTFCMLMLVTADNLVQMFFGWEGVGLASYLLIDFGLIVPGARAAAIKAFVVNRVGDVGFALGIFALFALTGTVHLESIFAQIPPYKAPKSDFLGFEVEAITLCCLLLFLGAMGNQPSLACIHGCPMQWRGQHRFLRLSMRQQWSRRVYLWCAACRQFLNIRKSPWRW